MIAAIATIFNDSDIAGQSIANLYDNGIDEVYIALSVQSTDDIREVLAPFPLTIIDDTDTHHYQPKWQNYLAGLAAEDGADWIIPFDADEFWYAVSGEPISHILPGLAADVCTAVSYQHLNADYRFHDTGLGKVAYRWHPGAFLLNGNHGIAYPNAHVAHDILALREIQFRSLEHLNRKCVERVDRIDPSLPYSEGTHQRILAAMTQQERADFWATREGLDVIYDPVPKLRR